VYKPEEFIVPDPEVTDQVPPPGVAEKDLVFVSHKSAVEPVITGTGGFDII